MDMNSARVRDFVAVVVLHCFPFIAAAKRAYVTSSLITTEQIHARIDITVFVLIFCFELIIIQTMEWCRSEYMWATYYLHHYMKRKQQQQ